MPIKIPETLPAFDVLRHEGVMVMSEETARRQDIRPLQIGLVNLMPKKVQTETQFARVIASTPLQIELTLIRMSEHQPKNTSAAHLEDGQRCGSSSGEQRRSRSPSASVASPAPSCKGRASCGRCGAGRGRRTFGSTSESIAGVGCE